MTMKAWPSVGLLPCSSNRLSASTLSAAPVSATQSSSTTMASSAPLVPPAASIVPDSAALASVVGRPSASSAQPSGIGSPCWAAFMMRPRATLLSARSITSGGASRRGKAAAIGLVPKSGRLPPGAGIEAGALAKASATSPFSAMRATGMPMAPEWLLLVTPAKLMPCSRVRSIASASAISSAG